MSGLRPKPFQIVTLLIALSSSLAAPRAMASEAVATCSNFARILREQKPLVVIVAPAGGGKARGSEAYADWTAYRDQFLSRLKPGICVVSITPAQYRRRFAEPALTGTFATLFARDGASGLLYSGMVLEPEVYRIGLAYIAGAGAEATNYGLVFAKLHAR